MSDDQDKSQKTEEPTDKKLRDARKKGDVPQSRETGTAMVVFALLMGVIFVAPAAMTRLSGLYHGLIVQSGQIGLGTHAAGVRDVGGVMYSLSVGSFLALAPLLGIMVAAALFGVMVQGETVVALERIKPKPEKLNPLSGFTKLFSPDALVEFGKNMGKVLIVGVISGWALMDLAGRLAQSESLVPETLTAETGASVRWILLITASVLVPIALADILWKRSSWKKKQMMSLKEVRDEHKDSEGDPQIRARRAELRMARARQRMAQAIPTASVVLTNPTHYAVALKYEQGVDQAPFCVAKGADHMAARIRELAREHEVPIVENKPLARALHAAVELDDQVPVEHWQAVAEIIGFIMGLKRDSRLAPPEGSRLREEL
ncbi:EscU/YscU/HrcU family type III secretion system export apparatus switch protein [Palleronia pelagia]|uniref:Flagellar biosynthetic protein FlhB n=1 Tax=Palleronia pelagia TaxID=387096 RepID=A0A1H8F1I3_9RHOB|nr:flagellar type III secretion system protein FlhB [Palleronia pelagia]SEN25589.1 flagellar biosynthetic protein FlhB [Palleronia pelagia]